MLHATEQTQSSEMSRDSHVLPSTTRSHDGPSKVDMPMQPGRGNAYADTSMQRPAPTVETPYGDRLPHEDVWALVRRFNNQTYQLRAIEGDLIGDLDMNIAADQEFTPDKLRGIVERFYMTVVIDYITFTRHIARLRSWREPRRTVWFCASYFFAWSLDVLILASAVFSIALVMSPKYRTVAFPAIPIALVSDTGKVHRPPTGALRSTRSITGAPEAHKGEAVEAEASHFVTGMARIALASVSVPRTQAITSSLADANTRASGNHPLQSHEETKAPMEELMCAAMSPLLEKLNNVTDAWERAANALAPSFPFLHTRQRTHVAGCIVVLFILTHLAARYLSTRLCTLVIGLNFFAQPILVSTTLWLDSNVQNWRRHLDLRNSLFRGTPTNSQLTIAILRIAEKEQVPIPPPPRSDVPESCQTLDTINEQTEINGDNVASMDSQAEFTEPPLVPVRSSSIPKEQVGDTGGHSRKRIATALVRLAKSSVKTGIKTMLTADSLLAKAGSSAAKQRQGIVPRTDDVVALRSTEFAANCDGIPGIVYLSIEGALPRVAFAETSTKQSHIALRDPHLQPIWSTAINDIQELKKIGGYSWKVKLAVSWALDRTINDGMIIVSRQGDEWHLTAVAERDELFNRLASMGDQKWES